ncbi:hypothetical protein [Geothrix fuzhouensis]|uniref:hypothetical protein n=1 Tax=Geothrix fuzhouensis TaxID=2966451 RepID=UPI00214962EF|nr:hypothetical protein [Geothrix fuzhouensis]
MSRRTRILLAIALSAAVQGAIVALLHWAPKVFLGMALLAGVALGANAIYTWMVNP